MAYYKVGQGENSKRIDLFFDEKPDDEIIKELKASRWKWYAYNKCWYTYDSEEHREQAERLCKIVNDERDEYTDDYDLEYDLVRGNYFRCLEDYGKTLSLSTEEKIRSLSKKKVSKVSLYYSGKKYYVDSILKDIQHNNAVVVDLGNNNFEIYFSDEIVVFTQSKRTTSYLLKDKKGKTCTLIPSKLKRVFLMELRANAKHFGLNKKNVEIYDSKYEKAKEDFLNRLKMCNVDLKDEVVVKHNIFRCEECGHHIEDLCGVINVLNRNAEEEQHKIWVGHCNECEEFFIMKNDFLAIKQKGVLLCNLISEKTINEYDAFDNVGYLNDESILKQYGYHVGKNSELTVEQRRKILELLLENNIISRAKIISLLNYFISMRENSKYDFSQAISDWKNDIRYISGYKLEDKPQIEIRNIRSKW